MKFRNTHYILDDAGEPVLTDMMTWARWFGGVHNRQVALARVGDIKVSTVFLGLDHNFDDDGPPVLWETMIFGGPHDGYQDRYSSRQDALDGHKKALALVGVPPGEVT